MKEALVFWLKERPLASVPRAGRVPSALRRSITAPTVLAKTVISRGTHYSKSMHAHACTYVCARTNIGLLQLLAPVSVVRRNNI